jgi:hypothetical protein
MCLLWHWQVGTSPSPMHHVPGSRKLRGDDAQRLLRCCAVLPRDACGAGNKQQEAHRNKQPDGPRRQRRVSMLLAMNLPSLLLLHGRRIAFVHSTRTRPLITCSCGACSGYVPAPRASLTAEIFPGFW